MEDILLLLQYRKVEDFDGFEDWLNDEIRDAKRATRREWAIGIICALVHNFGQLIVAIITAGNLSVLGYAPVLLISGTVTGAVTGTVLRAVMPALERVTETITRKGGK